MSSSYGTNGKHSPRFGGARNAILFIGDGMGYSHRFAGQLLSQGPQGRLAMDRLPHYGLMGTVPDDPRSFVTDSAAAASAIATGEKTYNGAIALGADGEQLPTVLEAAARAGKSTGLVTTCQITDATPAAFGAHVPNRAAHSEIARQYLEATGVDVILGGGAAYWVPPDASTGIPLESAEPRLLPQGTAGDLIGLAAALGYPTVRSAAELLAVVDDPGTRRVLGLFANQELFRQRAEGFGDTYDPPVSLAAMTEAALRILARNDDGFFLMVEESAIDRMAHRNNARLTLKGVLELDRALAVGLEFAAAHPDTLVIAAADHECGGLAVAGSDDPAYPYELVVSGAETTLAEEDGPFPVAGTDLAFVMGWATTGHTATAIPVTAIGPGAEQVAGYFENTDLHRIMLNAMQLPKPEPALAGAGSSRASLPRHP